MDENQNPETNKTPLNDCSFSLTMKDGSAHLQVEGTLGDLAEALANVGLHSEPVAELIKMSAFMLMQHEISQMMGSSDENEVPEDIAGLVKSMFGTSGGEA